MLAYEIVINSDPCISYLMEENSMTMQALVIAHACYGHNSFFKGNYLFRTWTDASAIIDYMLFAKQYIARCEEKHGTAAVEQVLDACHALKNYGVDRYKRRSRFPWKRSSAGKPNAPNTCNARSMIYGARCPKLRKSTSAKTASSPAEPEENLLYFIEKNSPLLEPWQREVVRIVRKIAQYFYPQRQTQVMNEGWACFWHYRLLNDLFDDGHVTPGFMMEFLTSHTSVLFQPAFDHPGYSGINPYSLGYAMFTDIRRICEQPTDEDRRWFPELAGAPWLEVIQGAMRDYRDESFIQQFLSPKVMRDLRLFGMVDDDQDDAIEVIAIHDDAGYRVLRQLLASQYDLGRREPNVQASRSTSKGDRSLALRHVQHDRRPIAASADLVLEHVQRLWGFPVTLDSVGET